MNDQRALILFGHADPQRTFNHDLADGYARGFEAVGGSVERIDLGSLAFDPILRAGYRTPQPLEPDLVRVKLAIEAASHVVWMFPIYWASPPTLVRGLCDRLLLPKWAFRFDQGSAFPKGLLAGRSSRVVMTMDSPSWWYTAVNHRNTHRSFGTATLSFCGFSPVEFTTIHSVHGMGLEKRARWVEKVDRIGEKDARRRAPSRTAELVA